MAGWPFAAPWDALVFITRPVLDGAPVRESTSPGCMTRR